jgi:hypothetical protein
MSMRLLLDDVDVRIQREESTESKPLLDFQHFAFSGFLLNLQILALI